MGGCVGAHHGTLTVFNLSSLDFTDLISSTVECRENCSLVHKKCTSVRAREVDMRLISPESGFDDKVSDFLLG